MSRMLRDFHEDFQRFAVALGFSTRHARDMERKTVTAQQASDLALVESELERLGVFGHAGIDSKRFAATEREARIAILGVAGLRDRKKNPRHRPPGLDAPLLADKIVQSVLFERAANPGKQMKQIVPAVEAHYGVSRSYVFRCVKQIAPERRRQMVQSITVSCFWPEMMAHLQIIAGQLQRPHF